MLGNGLKKNAITDRQRDFQKRLETILKTTTTLDIKDLSIDGNDLKKIFHIPELHLIREYHYQDYW